MIEINLLPEELKKKKKAFQVPTVTLKFMPLAIGMVVLLIAVHALLAVTINIKNTAHDKMAGEWEMITPQKRAVELTRRENVRMRKKAKAIESLIDERVLWFMKLNQLSDLIIPGVWFTKLSIDKKAIIIEPKDKAKPQMAYGVKKLITERIELPYLNIEGEVSSVYGDELAIVGKFIEQLKSNPEFFQHFSNIELDSTELHSIEEAEVMKFSIDCYFEGNAKDERS